MRKTYGTLDAELLGLGAVNELGADLLEGGDLAGGELYQVLGTIGPRRSGRLVNSR